MPEFKRLFVILPAMLIAGPWMAAAQDDPPRPPVRGMGAVLLPDDFARMRTVASGGSSWVTSSTTNGVTTTKGKSEEDGEFEIIDDPENGITVKLTREYGVEDADELMETHPDLYMYLKAIPKEVGDSQIRIKMDITTTYKAADADELKDKNQDAFKVYEKYSKGAVGGADLEMFGRGRLRPLPGRLELAPLRIEGVEGITVRMRPDGSVEIVKGDEEAEEDAEPSEEPQETAKPVDKKPGKDEKPDDKSDDDQ